VITSLEVGPDFQPDGKASSKSSKAVVIVALENKRVRLSRGGVE
jgi:hypothetical protein